MGVFSPSELEKNIDWIILFWRRSICVLYVSLKDHICQLLMVYKTTTLDFRRRPGQSRCSLDETKRWPCWNWAFVPPYTKDGGNQSLSSVPFQWHMSGGPSEILLWVDATSENVALLLLFYVTFMFLLFYTIFILSNMLRATVSENLKCLPTIQRSNEAHYLPRSNWFQRGD